MGQVLILKVNQNLGVVVYENGEKVGGLDVSHLFWKWEHELKDLQETYSFQGISPPPPQPDAKPRDSWMARTRVVRKVRGKDLQRGAAEHGGADAHRHGGPAANGLSRQVHLQGRVVKRGHHRGRQGGHGSGRSR